MKKVLLIYPPIEFGKKREFGLNPPLGVLYLASFLKEKGIDARVIDAFVEGFTFNELKEEILDSKADIIGFSAMTCQLNPIMDMAKELKRTNPSLTIIVGGSHINSTLGELFKFTSDIDFMLHGESEETLFNLVEALDKNLPYEDVEGLIYKKDGATIVNNRPKALQNIDELPFPNLNLIKINRYNSFYAKSLPMTSMKASRGCPFSCTFCSAHDSTGKKIRYRSAKNIVDELELNSIEHGINQVVFKDSTFTINKKWVYEICDEIKNRGLKINWTCNTRVDMVDEKILRAMKSAGCYTVCFGIESGSQKVLNMLKKNITVEQVRTAVALCKKIGLETMGNFMIGNPGETEEDAKQTVALSKEIKLDLANFGVTVAFPGTEIYTWALANNQLEDRYWYMKKNMEVSSHSREINGHLNTKELPLSKQTELVKLANRNFCFRPLFILKQAKKIIMAGKISNLTRAVKYVTQVLY